mmetsp:Transcript_8394/g.20881  ORF Transcript_8394/g.20881 Transcript_8394/m.20881 type:complete len:226 (+) Transcript_8394:1487-2164(+)
MLHDGGPHADHLRARVPVTQLLRQRAQRVAERHGRGLHDDQRRVQSRLHHGPPRPLHHPPHARQHRHRAVLHVPRRGQARRREDCAPGRPLVPQPALQRRPPADDRRAPRRGDAVQVPNRHPVDPPAAHGPRSAQDLRRRWPEPPLRAPQAVAAPVLQRPARRHRRHDHVHQRQRHVAAQAHGAHDGRRVGDARPHLRRARVPHGRQRYGVLHRPERPPRRPLGA